MAGFKHLLATLVVCSLASIGLAEYIMVCYYTNWSQYRNGVGKFMPPDIDPNLCTHIVYAFGKLDGNKITNFEWNDNDDYSNLYKQVNDHKKANPSLKTLLAMGGWTAGSLIYSNMASTAANRKEFIDSAISWLRKYNFDGLDMDWEYPANRDGKPYDKENFAHLCKETREAFDNEAATTGRERLLFTSAVGAGIGVVDTAYDVPVMAQYMDFICIMSYDLHGSWESFTGLHTGLNASDADLDKTLNVVYAANYWHQKGAPRNKLIIGLGTYGRSFTLVDSSNHGVGAPASGPGAPGTYTRENGFLSYYEICEMQKNGGTTYRDPVAKVPYYVNPNTKLWVGFDDKTSIYAKLTELIIKDGYGGAMTWALDLDDFTGTICGEGKYPLISLMKNVLDEANGGGTVKPPTTSEPGTNPPTNAPTTAAPTNAPTTTRAPSVTTPEGGGPDGICTQSSHGYIFPNVNDCTTFYQCVHGHAVVIRCQSGLLFNVATGNCDWPNNVVCASTTQAPVTASQTTIAPSSKPTSIVPTTSSPAGSGFCSTASNGLHPDPLDCAQYYNCWNGAGDPIKCPDGQYFSTKYMGCDHAENVECNVGSTNAPPTIPPSTFAPSTNAPSTIAPSTDAPSTNAPPTNAPPTDSSLTTAHSTSPPCGTTECPPTQFPPDAGFCSTASNGLHPDPSDCAQYYNCWDGIGDPLRCPDGQYFSTKYMGCDHAENVECNVGSTNAPPTSGPTQPPPSTAAPTQGPTTQLPPVSCEEDVQYLTHPTDCTKFYQCSHGVATEKTCQSGLYFSLKLSTCVWPADSECEP